jgi:hypothetical protein
MARSSAYKEEEMIRIAKTFLVVLALALLVGVFVGPSQADQWNKETVFTFSQPVEIPGGKVLPAGTYVFKLFDSQSWRHIVQIWNEDRTQLLATILAIPNYRLEPTGESVINFNERPGICPGSIQGIISGKSSPTRRRGPLNWPRNAGKSCQQKWLHRQRAT